MTTTPVLLSSAEKAFLRFNLNKLHDRIAVRAYFKAEKRGFVPGHELDDWLEAEDEILAEEAFAHLQPDD